MRKVEKTKKDLTKEEKDNNINNNKGDKEKKEDKRARKRSRWFSLVLYPDNSYHVDFMTYLQNKKKEYYSEFQGFYIYHQPEDNEKKAHWHLILYFPNERTVGGVCKLFGKGNYYIDSRGKKRAVFDLTGFPKDIEIQVCDNVTPDICEAVSDIHSIYQYLLHRTYDSFLKGKRVYDRKDIKYINNDFEVVSAVVELPKKIAPAGAELIEIMTYIENERLLNMSSLLHFLYINDRGDLIKYIERHSYLVKSIVGG